MAAAILAEAVVGLVSLLRLRPCGPAAEQFRQMAVLVEMRRLAMQAAAVVGLAGSWSSSATRARFRITRPAALAASSRGPARTERLDKTVAW